MSNVGHTQFHFHKTGMPAAGPMNKVKATQAGKLQTAGQSRGRDCRRAECRPSLTGFSIRNRTAGAGRSLRRANRAASSPVPERRGRGWKLRKSGRRIEARTETRDRPRRISMG
jgi:hypothetical protein